MKKSHSKVMKDRTVQCFYFTNILFFGVGLSVHWVSSTSQAQQRPSYYVRFEAPKRIPKKVGDIINPGYSRRCLEEKRRTYPARAEKLLEKRRNALIRQGVLPSTTPGRLDSVFACDKIIGRWKTMDYERVPIKIEPIDPNQVITLDLSNYDKLWPYMREFDNTSLLSEKKVIVKKMIASADAYWRSSLVDAKALSNGTYYEVLIGKGAIYHGPWTE